MDNKAPFASAFERSVIFDEPFAYICININVSKYCSYCLRPPANNKLLYCSACEFARYCNKDCQRLAWKCHKKECSRLNAIFPNLPLTEVLFLSRIMDRLLVLETYDDKFGLQSRRKWSDLLGHQDDIRSDEAKMGHFEKIYGKIQAFRKDDDVNREKFFDIFCKTAINSHSIHTCAGEEIGIALDLGISAYDHSCRPNCSLVFDGFRAFLRPLIPTIDATDPKIAFISYIDLGRSRYQRRKELQAKWYFICECERCKDQIDNILTSILCTNKSCEEPIIISEDSEVTNKVCTKCGQDVNEEHIKNCQDLMKSLPSRFSPNIDAEELKKHFAKANEVLHPKNIYLTRIRTALMVVEGVLTKNLDFLQSEIIENYKLCFPKADRHNGFQLLHIVKALIESDKRKEAISYAYEAMCIFEICFGLEHPYYLQTLALWTFLDMRAEKTNDELLSLMNFEHNQPVDLSKYLFT